MAIKLFGPQWLLGILALPAYFLSLKFNGSLSLSLSLRIFPLYKASFILAAKKFRKLIFKHMLLPLASLADENWLFFTKKEGIIFLCQWH